MLETGTCTESPSEAVPSTVSYLRRLRASGEPIVVTINGAAKLVVQDGESFQKLVELADWIETAEAIQEGIEATDRGEGRPADEVFAEIRRKHNLPPAN